MARPSKYSPELRERAVRLLFDHAHEHSSQWATIRSVAKKLGCTVEALRRWVRQAERETGQRPSLTTDERQRLKQLEHKNFELRRANEILNKGLCVFRPGGARTPSEFRAWMSVASHPTDCGRLVQPHVKPHPKLDATGHLNS